MKSRYWRMGLVAGLGLFCGWMSARILPGLGKGVACCFSCFFPCFNIVFLRGGWPGLGPAGEVLFFFCCFLFVGFPSFFAFFCFLLFALSFFFLFFSLLFS